MKLKRLIQLGTLTILFLIVISFTPVIASGVAITLSDGSGIADGGSGDQTDVNISWTSSGFYTTGTTMTFTISPATTSTIADCGTPSTSFGGSTGSFGSFTTSSAVFTADQAVATGTLGSLCLRFQFVTSTATNYSISMNVTSSTTGFTTTNIGAALYYVLGGNQINVIATVPSSISFSIRNEADTADTNTCALGTLSLSQVNTCSYRLRIATNAVSGFFATMQTDGGLTNGSASMTPITNDTAFAAGTEAYGISLLQGATTGGYSGGNFAQPIVEAGAAVDSGLTFDVDSTPINFTSATTILSYAGPFETGTAPSATSTSLITHAASVGSGTLNGDYSQHVTYRVTGSF
ncbi:MAG: hypothetical protein WC477_06715 [Patescibacteria group bacterium]